MNYKSKIYRNEKVTDKVYLMEVDYQEPGNPGQFYMLKAWGNDPLLGRPFGICDIKENKLSFLYEVVGRGTKILSNLNQDQTIELIGPLGNGFPLTDQKAAIVAGGCGLAPMVYLAKQLPIKPDVYLGYKSDAYAVELIKPYADKIIIASEDGSSGQPGFITDYLEASDYPVVYGCGPDPMMRALKQLCKDSTLYLSMDAYMACGVGACLGCTIETVDGLQRVCMEGPVFNGKDVFNDES